MADPSTHEERNVAALSQLKRHGPPYQSCAENILKTFNLELPLHDDFHSGWALAQRSLHPQGLMLNFSVDQCT